MGRKVKDAIFKSEKTYFDSEQEKSTTVGNNLKFVDEVTNPLGEAMTFVDHKGNNTKNPNEAYAKTLTYEYGIRYFVRFHNAGYLRGSILDPISFGRPKNLNAREIFDNELSYPFQPVNESCFLAYRDYLKTNRLESLTDAQRFSKEI